MQNEAKLSEAGAWYRDRDEWLRHLVRDGDLSPTDIRVGVFIAMHMNRQDAHTKHQQSTIARELHMHRVTAVRSITKLSVMNYIAVEKVVRGRRNRAVNRYRLIFAWASDVA